MPTDLRVRVLVPTLGVLVAALLVACSSDPTPTPPPTPTRTPEPLEVRIVASLDATLIEDDNGARANSADPSGNFVGMTNNGSTRRLLVAFDLSAIPAGSTIASARLAMHLSRAAGLGESNVSLYRLTREWAEGTSDARGEGGRGAPSTPGDPTWVHSAFDTTLWDAPGGDYVATPSATALIGSEGDFEWASDGLVADVQSWVGDPASNFGWIAIGDESKGRTAKRFDSRENPDEALRPALVIVVAP